MNSVLLQCPQNLQRELNVFRPCFSKPQFANFCSTVTAMIESQHSWITRFAAVAGKDQSTTNHFFQESPWDESLVHDTLSKLTVASVKDAWILIVDDTLSHKKYAQHTDYVDWYYDGMSKKEARGNSVVTCCLHSDSVGAIPFDESLYKKTETKNDMVCKMVLRAAKFKQFDFCIFDSFYSNKQVINCVKQCSMHYITEIKSNRNATISRRERWVREHEELIQENDWTITTIREQTYAYFQTSAFIKGIGNVNLVFSKRWSETDKEWDETFYLISDVLCLPAETLIKIFLNRGGIEEFHREGKQQLGLESYVLRKSRGIERYLFLVMLTYTLLMLLQATPETPQKSIGKLREEARAASYTMLFRTIPRKNHELIEQTSRRLAYAT